MDPESQRFLIIIITLLCSAFFSGMEIAFVSSNKLKIELDKQQGYFSGRVLSYFVKETPKFISSMLLGNNVSLVIYGIYMAMVLEPVFAYVSENQAVILILQTICSTLLVLITAEFLPKALFRINPNRSLKYGVIPLVIIYGVFYIPTMITMWISELFLKLVKVDISDSEQAFTKVDLDHYVRDINERMEEESEMENELQILQNALEFPNVKARDCMVPRTEIIALNIDDDIQVLKELFISSGLSKVVIYRDNIDNIIGYVHAHEMLSKPESIKQILLPIFVVPEAVLVKDSLEQFTKQKRSIAVVVDEFGGTSGIITVEDIVEEIFGEIEDEHDHEDDVEQIIDENTYLFSGRMEIDYLQQEYEIPISESAEYETIAGFIINKLEEIPKPNTLIETDDLVITVMEVSESKIDLVKVKVKD
ncbi:hemolysin family protein [Paracrocinitomix mangrovi]|uniref:hemolysin family protein n=1 Tax=Paracrocinitomix mangrovi TaxID=2862509 RepID=UPI0021062BF4|nr:hemolysin family protein [Paracrocinitomix mangrovi]